MRGISKDLPFKEYWWEVAKITEGEEEQWEVYDILPRFARALGTPFNLGSEMERGFSKQSDAMRDVKRNRMTRESLDAHL